ncbi:MAG TPA: ATP-binding protein [Stellaceae bacterium]
MQKSPSDKIGAIHGDAVAAVDDAAGGNAVRPAGPPERERRLLTELRDERALLDALFANAPVGFAFFDREHRYVRLNPALARMNGLPAAAHLGRTLHDVLPVNAAAVGPVIDRVFATGEAVPPIEIAGETPAAPGVRRHWLSCFYPVRETPGDGGGAVRWVGAVVTEITARKRAEAALRELNETLEQRVGERTRELAAANARLLAEIAEREQTEAALRQAQKLEAVGQLTGGIAHDFNNILTIISGNLQMLRQRLGDDGTEPAAAPPPGGVSALRRLADSALSGVGRAEKLTAQLLAYSRRQRLDPRPLALAEIVGEMADLLRRTLGERIDLRCSLQPDLPPAHADRNQLETALLNLVINARDAMPEGGGIVTIATGTVLVPEDAGPPPADAAAEAGGRRWRRRDGAAAAAALPPQPGRYVTVTVSDTGRGMPAEVLDHAFEPFFTTKEPGKGTGLGLAMVYGFANQSGGYVRIDSREGEGTRVTICLPLAPDDGMSNKDNGLRGDPQPLRELPGNGRS